MTPATRLRACGGLETHVKVGVPRASDVVGGVDATGEGSRGAHGETGGAAKFEEFVHAATKEGAFGDVGGENGWNRERGVRGGVRGGGGGGGEAVA